MWVRGIKEMEVEISLIYLEKYWGSYGDKYVELN